MPGPLTSYKGALDALSRKTGTPLSSLVVSFAVLHEATALVPLVGFFYAARWGGLGDRAVGALGVGMRSPEAGEEGWVTKQCREWMEEGEQRTARLGRRYGIFGFDKNVHDRDASRASSASLDGVEIAGDVANAIFAYVATKVRLNFELPFTYTRLAHSTCWVKGDPAHPHWCLLISITFILKNSGGSISAVCSAPISRAQCLVKCFPSPLRSTVVRAAHVVVLILALNRVMKIQPRP
jgi:hypothetical protein